MNKFAYKPIGWVLGLAAGAFAGFVFKRVWQAVADSDEAPDATDERSTWTEVLAAAALQGLIFAVVKAAVDRGGAAGFRRLTGSWPT
jgi:protein-S-isoprenylcysteine O-methyltransferase Ste14